MNDEALKQAIQLIRAGRRREARPILEALLKTNACNVPAWLWYAETYTEPEERLQILEMCARYNPGQPQVRQALAILRAQQMKPAPPQSAMAPTPPLQPQSQNQSVVPPPPQSQSIAPPAPSPPSQSQSIAPPRREIALPAPASAPKRGSLWVVWIAAFLSVGALALLMFLVWLSAPKNPLDYRHVTPVEYYLYAPKSYSADRAWPLFIGVHGFGGSGLDCWNLWQTYADREGFILLCPSLSDARGGWYQGDGEAKLFAALGQVQQNYRLDSRYFLVGFSAGAQFVQGFAFNYPHLTQAVAVLSAGNYYTPTPGAAGIPFLIVIGDRDDPAAISGSMQFADLLAQNGSSVDYWLLPGIGHTVTTATRRLTIAFFRSVNGR